MSSSPTSWLASHVGLLGSSSHTGGATDAEVSELNQLAGGLSGSLTVLRGCLEDAHLGEGGEAETVPLERQLLAAVIRQLLPQPNFPTLLCEAVRQIRGLNDQFLRDLCQALNLSLSDRLRLGLALGSAEDKSRRRESQKFCASSVSELVQAPSSELSEDVLHQVSCHLHRIARSAKQASASVAALPTRNSKVEGSLVLAPLFGPEVSEVNCLRSFEQADSSTSFHRDGLLQQLSSAIDVAHVVEELGYDCTSDGVHCKEVLSVFPSISEGDVSKIAGMVARTHTGLNATSGAYTCFLQALCNTSLVPPSEQPSSTSWDIDVLIDTIGELLPDIDWVSVTKGLDHEGFVVPDQEAFHSLYSFFGKACQEPFPMDRVCGRIWRNHEGQLSFLKYALATPPDVVKLFLSSDKQSAQKGWREYRSPYDAQQWLSLDLLGVLCLLSEMGHAATLRRPVLENLVNWGPGLLMMKLAEIRTEWNLVQSDLLAIVLPQFILGVEANRAHLRQIWRLSPSIVMCELVSLHAEDPSTTPTLVDVCVQLEVIKSHMNPLALNHASRSTPETSQTCETIETILDATPFSFSIDLAARYWWDSSPKLGSWLEKHLIDHKDVMFQSCLKFLVQKVKAYQGDSGGNERGLIIPLQVQSLFFSALEGVFPEESDSRPFKAFLDHLNGSTIWREHSGLMLRSICAQYDAISTLSDRELKITAVVLGSLIQLASPDDAISLGLKCVYFALGNPVESRLFHFGLTALEHFRDCLIEMPWYSKMILALPYAHVSYGDLLEALEESAAADVAAVSPISGAVTRPVGLEQFSANDALAGTKQQQQRQILQKREDANPEKVYVLGSATSAPSESSSSQAPVSQIKQTNFLGDRKGASVPSSAIPDQPSASLGHSLPIDTLLAAAQSRDAPVLAPDATMRSKIIFIVNNISASNIDLKAEELRGVLQQEHHLWFAQYLVMERASIEPNFHDLYLQFLDKIDLRRVKSYVLQSTLDNIKVLLSSNLLWSSVGERQLLRNLGSWLGKLTIGKNACLRARDVDPKLLLLEAYEKGLMFAVLPFITKVIEPCQSTMVYRLPNPWTSAILGLLAEIYLLENLQKNLQFEIEIFFKNIDVELHTFRASELLMGRKCEVDDNPDFKGRTPGHSQQAVVKEERSSSLPVEPTLKLPTSEEFDKGTSRILASHASHAATLSYGDGGVSAHGVQRSTQLGVELVVPYQPGGVSSMTTYPTVPPSVVMNQRLLSCGKQFKVLVQKGMEKAIEETLQHIFDHYLGLACTTTQVLVSKDYASEKEPSRAHEAAYIMVAGLAGRLAGLCKDQFRNAMYNNIALMLSKGLAIKGEILGQAVDLVTADNLSLGFAAVEDATIRFALQAMREMRESDNSMWRQQQGHPSGTAIYPGSRYGRQGSETQPYKPIRSSTSWQRAYEGYGSFLPQKGPMSASGLPVGGQVSDSGNYSFAPESPVGSSAGLCVSDMPDDELDPSARLPMGFVSNALFDEAAQLKDKKMNHSEEGSNLLDLASDSGSNSSTITTRAADVASLRDQAARFFQKWMLICQTTAASSDKGCVDFMAQLQRSDLLGKEETFDPFFQSLLELAVTHSLNSDFSVSSIYQPDEGPSFTAIDTFAKLVVLLVRRDAGGEPGIAEVNLLKKALKVTVRVIKKNADEKTHNFHPRLYFRLFVTWLMDFSAAEWDPIKLQVLTSFGNALGSLQPSRLPCWTFAWWELVSHRKFMPRLLLTSSEAGWPLFHRLLVAHLKFMEPYLRVACLVEPILTLYKGTLRVLLVLLHDFPEFLSAYYFSLCAEIPSTCIQMRNLILSAFPRKVILPDPLSSSLKVDMLPEMQVAPLILSDVGLGDEMLKSEVDLYLRTWQAESVSSLNLRQRLMLPEEEARKAGTQYNVPLLRALVLRIGIEAIRGLQTSAQESKGSWKQIGRSAPMTIFYSLMVDLDKEGRHLFCSALADHLRYPNSHTHYFSCVLLYLFAKFEEELWREQIARVLIERFVAQRPHPWGLKVTVIELARNSALGLWDCAFMEDVQIRHMFLSLLPPGGK